MLPFDRFTQRAQEVPQIASEIMQRYGHTQLDTEHVLLALIEQPQGVVPQIFDLLKVAAKPPADRLDAILRASPKMSAEVAEPGQIFITPRVAQIINLANEETIRMKDEKISTEHIFLAILSERDTPVALLLEDAGLTRERVIDSIQQLRRA